MGELSLTDRVELLKKYNLKRPVSDDTDFNKLAVFAEGFTEDGIKKIV